MQVPCLRESGAPTGGVLHRSRYGAGLGGWGACLFHGNPHQGHGRTQLTGRSWFRNGAWVPFMAHAHIGTQEHPWDTSGRQVTRERCRGQVWRSCRAQRVGGLLSVGDTAVPGLGGKGQRSYSGDPSGPSQGRGSMWQPTGAKTPCLVTHRKPCLASSDRRGN